MLRQRVLEPVHSAPPCQWCPSLPLSPSRLGPFNNSTYRCPGITFQKGCPTKCSELAPCFTPLAPGPPVTPLLGAPLPRFRCAHPVWPSLSFPREVTGTCGVSPAGPSTRARLSLDLPSPQRRCGMTLGYRSSLGLRSPGSMGYREEPGHCKGKRRKERPNP